MKRIAIILVVTAILAAFTWQFPFFHIVPRQRAAEQRSGAAFFNAARFAQTFWSERLLKSLDRAVNADVLLPLLRSDPATARRRFSRTLGVSESYSYFVSGAGRVVAMSDDEISLAITDGEQPSRVALQVGLLFGNAVRDATGLLDVNDYPNSQDFNAISLELNRIIEARVLPELRRQVRVGGRVRFAGCAEINDPAADLNPLRVVPVWTEVQGVE